SFAIAKWSGKWKRFSTPTGNAPGARRNSGPRSCSSEQQRCCSARPVSRRTTSALGPRTIAASASGDSSRAPVRTAARASGGAQYLRRLLNLYKGNVPLALASYNAGATNVAQYGGVPPFPETQNYVKQITRLVSSSRRARTE